jgi:hypothetical protein
LIPAVFALELFLWPTSAGKGYLVIQFGLDLLGFFSRVIFTNRIVFFLIKGPMLFLEVSFPYQVDITVFLV